MGTQKERVSIFISSTVTDLQAEREAVKEVIENKLHQKAVMYERDIGGLKEPIQACIDKVKECDIYLGIFGDRYGCPTKSCRSPTEEEFDQAMHMGLLMLIFVKAIHRIDPKHPGLHKRFRKKIDTTQIWHKFNDKRDLENTVARDIYECLKSEPRFKSSFMLMRKEGTPIINVARVYYYLGAYKEAEKTLLLLRTATSLLKRDIDHLMLHIHLASGSYRKAGAFIQRSTPPTARVEINRIFSPNVTSLKVNAGYLNFIWGNYEDSLGYYQLALRDLDIMRASLLNYQAFTLQNMGNFEIARQKVEESIKIFAQHEDKDKARLANVLQLRADWLCLHRKYREAEKILGHMLQIYGDNIRMTSYTRFRQAMIAHEKGEYDKALEIYYDVERNFRKIGDRRGVSIALYEIARVLHTYKRRKQASKRMFEECLKLCRGMGDRRGELYNHFRLGNIYLDDVKFNRALNRYRKGIDIALEIGDPNGVAEILESIEANKRRIPLALRKKFENLKERSDRFLKRFHGFLEYRERLKPNRNSCFIEGS
jgi:tetratricopeptide (TPR) repeat protein